MYVASIVPNSSADRCGLIQPDDELVRVDNVEIGPQVKNQPRIEFPCSANQTPMVLSPSLDAAARALTLCSLMHGHVPRAVSEPRLTGGVALGRSLLRMYALSSSALLAAMSPSSSAAPQGTPRNTIHLGSVTISAMIVSRVNFIVGSDTRRVVHNRNACRISREAHVNFSHRAGRRPVLVADICGALDKCPARGG